jgi:UDP-GlcNAc:undecaprenyl-phosphate GlcNAc-1-phosphate transferase
VISFFVSVFVGSILLSAILTPFVRDVAVHLRWVDPANLGRHFHVKPVPRIGGVALFISFTAASAIGIAAFRLFGSRESISIRAALSFLLPALLVLLLGLCDDLFSLGPYWKLGIETIAAIGLYAGGSGIHSLGAYFAESYLRIPIELSATIFWVLLITNAFNLIDGLDGLACGSALIAAIVVCAISIGGHTPLISILAIALAGAALGFLRYNFHPATIFLGDSGSLLLGFLLSGLTIGVSSNAGVAAAIAAPVVCLGLPIMDVSLSVVRRFLGSKPLFNGDDEHIHHKLIKRGVSHRSAVLILYAVAAGFAFLGLALLHGKWTFGFAVVTIAVGVSRGTRELKYLEFTELAAAVRRFRQRRMIIANDVAIRRAIELLAKATPDFTEICEILRSTLEPLGFLGVAFSFTDPDPVDPRLFFPILPDANGRLALVWREIHSSSPDWELRLQLSLHSGKHFGDFVLLREEAAGPLWIDINLLSGEFRVSVSEILDQAIQQLPAGSRTQARLKSREAVRDASVVV